MLISVIVSTYNWTEALNLSLKSLSEQTDLEFEVIVADDGSKDNTRELVAAWKEKFPVELKHSWQEDKGFRLARSRNNAVTKAGGEYLIFIDGDCIVRSDFVASHRRLAEEHCVVAGQRILLGKEFTQACITDEEISWKESLSKLISLTLNKKINRFLPAVSMGLTFLRLRRPRKWQLLRGCNWALFKSDYLAVGGQDEIFEGWGYEDSDMTIRLINHGVRVKWGAFSSPCFHLWQKEADRTLSGRNFERLQQLLTTKQVMPQKPK